MPVTGKVYIIGFMGSGKTTAGRKLSSALGWSFADLDETIEKEQKKSIEKIFSESGETHFREIEYKALRKYEKTGNIVISTGGGVPCYSDNLSFMKSTGVVIYLKMTVGGLVKRLKGRQETRPLVKGLKEEELREYIIKKLKEREPFYSQADIIEDGSYPDIGKLAEKIREVIN